MQIERGNLVIYDKQGTILSQTGEASGDLLPHVYPVGIPYLELPYGSMKYESQKLIKIDVSVKPNIPVFEQLNPKPSDEEISIDNYTMDLIYEGVL